MKPPYTTSTYGGVGGRGREAPPTRFRASSLAEERAYEARAGRVPAPQCGARASVSGYAGKVLRLFYALEFLVALMATYTVWSQVGGQYHLDLMAWYWKLGLGVAISFAAVKATGRRGCRTTNVEFPHPALDLDRAGAGPGLWRGHLLLPLDGAAARRRRGAGFADAHFRAYVIDSAAQAPAPASLIVGSCSTGKFTELAIKHLACAAGMQIARLGGVRSRRKCDFPGTQNDPREMSRAIGSLFHESLGIVDVFQDDDPVYRAKMQIPKLVACRYRGNQQFLGIPTCGIAAKRRVGRSGDGRLARRRRRFRGCACRRDSWTCPCRCCRSTRR